ncbi:MAG: bifunctional folylpolyglutamate synthase/dihydrofolate synthase [Thermaerobacter sp.]|nr:bifunctional folylpolyglutamate synthase/dihydrofolate synthase [Thermaerobacter sp.]
MTVSGWIQRLALFGVRPGLQNIEALMERLGHPERRMRFIHVAGTNGKGSTAVMLAEALRSQGYRVGLTTSPDLGRVQERVVLEGAPIAPALWEDIGMTVRAAAAGLPQPITSFEAIIAIALLAFASSRMEWAVVEVGLGGRLDATNVIPPAALSVITPVAFDHMEHLGSRIEQIAAEKAGILKPGTRLVLARQPYPAARRTILDIARRRGIEVREPWLTGVATTAGAEIAVPGLGQVRVPLYGAFQADNLVTAWTAIATLAELGIVRRLNGARDALIRVKWPGRFEVLQRRPLWVVDGAHNPHGIGAVVNTVTAAPWDQYRWHVVFGVLQDKPAQEMLRMLLPHVVSVTLTRVPGRRGTWPATLAGEISSAQLRGIVEDPVAAVGEALSAISHDDAAALLTTGSLALLASLNRCRSSGLAGATAPGREEPQDSAKAPAVRRPSFPVGS